MDWPWLSLKVCVRRILDLANLKFLKLYNQIFSNSAFRNVFFNFIISNVRSFWYSDLRSSTQCPRTFCFLPRFRLVNVYSLSSDLDGSALVISISRKSLASWVFRFVNVLFHSWTRRFDISIGGFLLSVGAGVARSLNNYFPRQRSDRFFFYTFSFPLSTPCLFWRRRNIFLRRGLIFQEPPERCGLTQVSRVIFPCQTSSQKGAPHQAEEAERWSLYNLHKTRVYSRDESARNSRKEGKILSATEMMSPKCFKKIVCRSYSVSFFTRSNSAIYSDN